MNKLDAQRQKEIQQAEELLFAGPQALGFAKGLFQGHFVADWVMPYPRIPAAQQPELDETLTELRQFLDEHLDPAEIDRKADIPRSVIDGLGRVGVLGMTAPKEYGGRGFSQMANCKILEEIGRRCASTSVFVNSRVVTLWNARAKTAMATKVVDRRTIGRVCADRKGSRIRCGERANAGAAQRRWVALHCER